MARELVKCPVCKTKIMVETTSENYQCESCNTILNVKQAIKKSRESIIFPTGIVMFICGVVMIIYSQDFINLILGCLIGGVGSFLLSKFVVKKTR